MLLLNTVIDSKILVDNIRASENDLALSAYTLYRALRTRDALSSARCQMVNQTQVLSKHFYRHIYIYIAVNLAAAIKQTLKGIKNVSTSRDASRDPNEIPHSSALLGLFNHTAGTLGTLGLFCAAATPRMTSLISFLSPVLLPPVSLRIPDLRLARIPVPSGFIL